MTLSVGTNAPHSWSEWYEWALALIATHSPAQVAESMADLGNQAEQLKEAMAAEARIIEAQTLSLSPRALGKGRRRIVETQVIRMYGCAIDKNPPRTFGRDWRERAAQRRAEIGED